ncbi:glycosyltransferase [bacterium]|nr:glycosyltransferase [bacterium]
MKRREAKEETIEIQKTVGGSGGKLGKYMDLILGRRSLLGLMKFEMVIGVLGDMPGAVGILLRSKVYRNMLGKVGRNVTFGKGVTIRHPHKIFIGDDVIIDDGVLLDAKGQDNRGIWLGDGVFVGKSTILNCKNGDIILEDRVNLSSYVHIFSASLVRVGEAELVASFVYLVGGTHKFDDPNVPVLDQGRESRGIRIGPGGWLGAHVTVFDGVDIGAHAIIAANSPVSRRIPKFAVAGGSPIEIINRRKGELPEVETPPVCIALICYNCKDRLKASLDSVMALSYPAVAEVMVVDNASTDDTAAWVEENYPEVRFVRMAENNGPNPARNCAVAESTTELVLLLDGDIVLKENMLDELTSAWNKFEDAGVLWPQIRGLEDHSVLQYNGTHVQFIGAGIMHQGGWEKPEVVEAGPGGALLVSKEKTQHIGGFDEDFLFGWEDGDYSFRMTAAGFTCAIVPRAHVYHPQEKKGFRWVDYQVRNRWWFVLKNYHWWTLIVLMPAFLLYQLAITFFFALKGQLGACLRGGWWVITSLPSILKKRKRVQAVKVRRDRSLLSGRGSDMLGQAGASAIVRLGMKIMNGFFSLYWFIARWLVR